MKDSWGGGGLRLDLTGLGLIGACIAWIFVSALVSGGEPGPIVGVFAGVGLAYVLARFTGSVAPLLIPCAVGTLAAALAIQSHLADGGAGDMAGPLHYSNANAALFLQGTVAALMVFVVGAGAARRFALVAALGLSVATVLAGSIAADILLAFCLVGLVARGERRARRFIGISAGLLAMALVASISAGLAYGGGQDSSAAGRIVDRTLSQRRPALWRDALTLLASHPVAGVGPARFQFESPIARSDRDARWAHNGFLQQGAEGGLPGLVLLVLLFMWGFLGLWRAQAVGPTTALAAGALGALGVHACVDYVLHFPVLPIATAALVGAAASVTVKSRAEEALEPEPIHT